MSNLSTSQAVSGAAVQFVAGQTTRTTTSGSDGRYALSDLPLGAGTLTVTVTGFHALERAVTIAATTTADVGLTPSSAPPPPPPVPTATVRGTVLSKTSQQPIEGADVDLRITFEQRYKTVTDSAGKFALTGVPIGAHATLRIDAAGHTTTEQPVAVEAETSLSVEMTPTPVTPPPPPPSAFSTLLTLVDAFSRGGISGAVLTGQGLMAAASAGDGKTTVSSENGDTSPRRVTIVAPGYVTRETWLRVPGSAADIDLIPSSFDLGDFNALARNSGQLIRWTSSPRLFVTTSVMRILGNDHSVGYATSDSLTNAEIAVMKQDLREALPGLTGQTFSAFDGEFHGGHAPGAFAVSGRISVYRIVDLGLENGWWGATSVELNGSEITGCVILLDEALDRDASADDRTRVRGHELGHCLGFNHVQRQSIMAISHGLSSQLTPWDRQAMGLAYLRKPGNRSPDNDPHEYVTPNANGGRWSQFVGLAAARK